ncbi:unnamed protein product [Lupinus luteus]|uniref:Neprosin PEP catalytic domain-containing protein n=1 Tax=Lupinus luteus TaxID=3873 RepID=A0AAV1W2A6_LUPLU
MKATRLLSIGIEEDFCPEGTIPIQRITKDDLIRAKQLSYTNDDILNKDIFGRHDPETKNWWVILQNKTLEYYPQNLFSNLAFANVSGWTGMTSTPRGISSPPMGSGHFPANNLKQACYIMQMPDQQAPDQLSVITVKVAQIQYGALDPVAPEWRIRSGSSQSITFTIYIYNLIFKSRNIKISRRGGGGGRGGRERERERERERGVRKQRQFNFYRNSYVSYYCGKAWDCNGACNQCLDRALKRMDVDPATEE